MLTIGNFNSFLGFFGTPCSLRAAAIYHANEGVSVK